jgi:hypothetical protein
MMGWEWIMTRAADVIGTIISGRFLTAADKQAKTLALLTHRREALEHVRFAIWDIVHEDHIDSRTVAELTEAYRLSKLVFSKGVSGSLEKLHGIAFRLQGIPLLERTTQDQKDRDFLAGQIQKTLQDMESESAA